MDNEDAQRGRREFLGLAFFAPGVVALSVVNKKSLTDTSEVRPEQSNQGYQETEHVKMAYRAMRF